MVGQGQRLGPLQMGVTGNQGVKVLLGMAKERALKPQQSGIDGIDLLAQPEPQIRSNLVIAAAAGVQLFAERPQQFDQAALNGEMNVLGFQAWVEITRSSFLPNGFKAFDQLLTLLGADQVATAQHSGVGHRAIEVLLQQGDVKANRGVEPLNAGVQALLKAIAPARARTCLLYTSPSPRDRG